MRRRRQAARLAGEILKAMESGRDDQLRRQLDRAERLSSDIEHLAPYDAEQAEVLSEIARQLRLGAAPAPHIRILQHFAGTARLSLC
jgi:hypothetical protein